MPSYVPNPAGLALLARTLDLSATAEAGAAYAKSIAPVRTGAYRDSIRADMTDGAKVVAEDPDADIIELGDGDTREGHYVLSRTADWIESQ